jgi:hypothetical protein
VRTSAPRKSQRPGRDAIPRRKSLGGSPRAGQGVPKRCAAKSDGVHVSHPHPLPLQLALPPVAAPIGADKRVRPPRDRLVTDDARPRHQRMLLPVLAPAHRVIALDGLRVLFPPLPVRPGMTRPAPGSMSRRRGPEITDRQVSLAAAAPSLVTPRQRPTPHFHKSELRENLGRVCGGRVPVVWCSPRCRCWWQRTHIVRRFDR